MSEPYSFTAPDIVGELIKQRSRVAALGIALVLMITSAAIVSNRQRAYEIMESTERLQRTMELHRKLARIDYAREADESLIYYLILSWIKGSDSRLEIVTNYSGEDPSLTVAYPGAPGALESARANTAKARIASPEVFAILRSETAAGERITQASQILARYWADIPEPESARVATLLAQLAEDDFPGFLRSWVVYAEFPPRGGITTHGGAGATYHAINSSSDYRLGVENSLLWLQFEAGGPEQARRKIIEFIQANFEAELAEKPLEMMRPLAGGGSLYLSEFLAPSPLLVVALFGLVYVLTVRIRTLSNGAGLDGWFGFPQLFVKNDPVGDPGRLTASDLLERAFWAAVLLAAPVVSLVAAMTRFAFVNRGNFESRSLFGSLVMSNGTDALSRSLDWMNVALFLLAVLALIETTRDESRRRTCRLVALAGALFLVVSMGLWVFEFKQWEAMYDKWPWVTETMGIYRTNSLPFIAIQLVVGAGLPFGARKGSVIGTLFLAVVALVFLVGLSI